MRAIFVGILCLGLLILTEVPISKGTLFLDIASIARAWIREQAR